MKFRKKPVVIEAVNFTEKDKFKVAEFFKGSGEFDIRYSTDRDAFICEIVTQEGNMIAREGDWIIKGVKGEFYPCKPDIFEATYEKVD